MKSPAYLPLLLALAFLVGGCATSLHVHRGMSPIVRQKDARQVVRVVNPELQLEFAILSRSGIYVLSESDEVPELTLKPLHQWPRCGNPVIGTIITLGLLPGYLPGGYHFSYSLRSAGREEQYDHALPVYERFSIWERLVVQDRTSILADALSRSPRAEWPNQSLEPMATADTPRAGARVAPAAAMAHH